MKKILVIITIFSCLAVAASLTFAFKGGKSHMRPQEGNIDNPMSLSELNLTDEQKAKLHDLRTAHFKKIKPLLDKAYSKRGDLKLLWSDKNPDHAKILATKKNIRSLDAKIEDHTTLYELSVLKELTPEQWEKIRNHIRTHRSEPPHIGDPQFGPPHVGGHRFRPPPEGFGFGPPLQLSKEQSDSMKDSQRRFISETKDLRNNLAVKYREMRNLLNDPNADETALFARQKEISSLQQKLTDKKMEMMLRDRKILTPEQIAKFEPIPFDPDFMDRHMMEHHHH